MQSRLMPSLPTQSRLISPLKPPRSNWALASCEQKKADPRVGFFVCVASRAALQIAPAESRRLPGNADPRGFARQYRRQRPRGQFRTVVLLRQMRGDDVFEPAAIELRQQGRGGAI